MFAARSTAPMMLPRMSAVRPQRARPTMLASIVNKTSAQRHEQRSGYSSQQQQRQQSKAHQQEAPASNPHRDFYKDFGPPILKVFFGAFIIYQGLYYGWLKLEDIEKRHDSEAEIERLKAQIQEAQSKAKVTLHPDEAAQGGRSSRGSWYKFW